MAGKTSHLDHLIAQLFDFAQKTVDVYHQFPYVAFVTQGGQIISRSANEVYHQLDPSAHCDAVAIRSAQQSLETGDLSTCTLVSLFEPTVLSFDIARWDSISHYVWCLDKEDLPAHYTSIPYGPREYLRDHPQSITITRGIMKAQAQKIMQSALENKLSLIASPYSHQL